MQKSMISPNPIGQIHGSCPPRDWRNAPNIEMYNKVTRNVARDFNMPFLDTNFIIDLIWDSSRDWNHYRDEVVVMENVYLLDRMLSYS